MRAVVVVGHMTPRRRLFLRDLVRAGYTVYIPCKEGLRIWPTRVVAAPRRAALINLDLLTRFPSRAKLKAGGLSNCRCGTYHGPNPLTRS